MSNINKNRNVRNEIKNEKENNERLKKIGKKKRKSKSKILNIISLFILFILFILLGFIMYIYNSEDVTKSFEGYPKQISKRIKILNIINPIVNNDLEYNSIKNLKKVKLNSRVSFNIDEKNTKLYFVNNNFVLYNLKTKSYIVPKNILLKNKIDRGILNIGDNIDNIENDEMKIKILLGLIENNDVTITKKYANIVSLKKIIFDNKINYIYVLHSFSKNIYILNSKNKDGLIYIFDKKYGNYEGYLKYNDLAELKYLQDNIFPKVKSSGSENYNQYLKYKNNNFNLAVLYLYYASTYENEEKYFYLMSKLYVDKYYGKKINNINKETLNEIKSKCLNLLNKDKVLLNKIEMILK